MGGYDGLIGLMGSVPDIRVERSKRHKLIDILFIGLCAILSGGEGFQGVLDFGVSREDWLGKYLRLPCGTPPMVPSEGYS